MKYSDIFEIVITVTYHNYFVLATLSRQYNISHTFSLTCHTQESIKCGACQIATFKKYLVK